MTMNSSGPISLTGTTPGVSIQFQLGTTGPIALTDANVRALAGKPTGSVVMPDDFYGKGTPLYQSNLKIIKTTIPATNGVALGNIVFAPDGKMFGLWQYGPNTNSAGTFIVPSNTTTVFQTLIFNINGTTAASSAFNLGALTGPRKFDLENQNRIDDAGNVYFLITSIGTNPAWYGGAVKYNNSGTLISWNNYFGNAWPLTMAVVKATGEIYYAGNDTVFKTNSSGVIVWQRTTTQFYSNFATRVVSNPVNGGVFLVAGPVGVSYRVYSFDANGNSLGQVLINGTAISPSYINATSDSLGNLYVCSRNLGQAPVTITKISPALAILWSVTITPPIGQQGQIANNIAINEERDKLFFAYSIQNATSATSPARIGVACFNLSGVYQYGRQIESTVMMGAVSFGQDLSISTYGDSYVLTSSTSNTAVPTVTAGMCTFPTDGSKLGTYATFTDPTYGAISTTYSVLNPTVAAGGFTTSASAIAISTTARFASTGQTTTAATAALSVVANVNI